MIFEEIMEELKEELKEAKEEMIKQKKIELYHQNIANIMINNNIYYYSELMKYQIFEAMQKANINIRNAEMMIDKRKSNYD
jgi:hypothetical protein